jgi:hypothetical protein
MRWRKIVITILLSFAVALNTSALCFALVNESKDESVVGILQLVFALYLVIISARSVTQTEPESHSASIIHLSTLTTLASLLLATVAMLPSTPLPVIKTRDGLPLQGIWYSLVFLYTLACVLGVTVPLGPLLHHPPEHIYSAKTVAAITNRETANVCGVIGALYAFPLSPSPSQQCVTGASIWETLLFSYTTKVVWLGNIADNLDIGDLPILAADMRAAFNYSRMRSALRRYQLQIFSWKPSPGSGLSLAYKLARLNSRVLTVEVLIVIVSAVLFYGPAFFMRRLISYLEGDPHRENTGWGWVYVFGLFMSNAIMYLGACRGPVVLSLMVMISPLSTL